MGEMGGIGRMGVTGIMGMMGGMEVMGMEVMGMVVARCGGMTRVGIWKQAAAGCATACFRDKSRGLPAMADDGPGSII